MADKQEKCGKQSSVIFGHVEILLSCDLQDGHQGHAPASSVDGKGTPTKHRLERNGVIILWGP